MTTELLPTLAANQTRIELSGMVFMAEPGHRIIGLSVTKILIPIAANGKETILITAADVAI